MRFEPLGSFKHSLVHALYNVWLLCLLNLRRQMLGLTTEEDGGNRLSSGRGEGRVFGTEPDLEVNKIAWCRQKQDVLLRTSNLRITVGLHARSRKCAQSTCETSAKPCQESKARLRWQKGW